MSLSDYYMYEAEIWASRPSVGLGDSDCYTKPPATRVDIILMVPFQVEVIEPLRYYGVRGRSSCGLRVSEVTSNGLGPALCEHATEGELQWQQMPVKSTAFRQTTAF